MVRSLWQDELIENPTSVSAKSLQSCLTLCDPVDCSPPGSSVHGILQARRLEWVAMSSSRGSSGPPALQVVSLWSEPPGKPLLNNLARI